MQKLFSFCPVLAHQQDNIWSRGVEAPETARGPRNASTRICFSPGIF